MKPTPTALDQYLSVRQVAARLGISERSVWRRVAEAVLPAPVKVGRVTRWRETDLATAMERLQRKGARG